MDKDQELLIENSKKSLFWQRLRTVLVGIAAAVIRAEFSRGNPCGIQSGLDFSGNL